MIVEWIEDSGRRQDALNPAADGKPPAPPPAPKSANAVRDALTLPLPAVGGRCMGQAQGPACRPRGPRARRDGPPHWGPAKGVVGAAVNAIGIGVRATH